MGRIKGLALMFIGAAGGAAAAYYADPDRGRTRRARTADQIGAALRDGLDTVENQIDYQAGQAKGAVAERIDTGARDYDPRTLQSKIESEVLGHVDGVPSGEIVVVVEDDTVTLRGPVPTEDQIDEIVRRTRELGPVRAVRNELHLPGEPAPTSQEPIEASHQAS